MKTKFTFNVTIFSLIFIINFIGSFFNGYELHAQNIGLNGTGATPHPSALVDIDAAGGPSTGLLIPRIALTAINAAAPVSSPAVSLLVFNTATSGAGINAVSPGYYYWNGAEWVRFAFNPSGVSANSWNLSGNAGTNAATDFIGTTDSQDVVVKTNNLERMRVMTAGNIGINTITPDAKSKLDVNGAIKSPTTGVIWGSDMAFGGIPTTNGFRVINRANFGGTGKSAVVFEKTDNVSGIPTGMFAFMNRGTSGTNGDTALTITGSGNVGIGTANPWSRLTVAYGDIQVGEVMPSTGTGRRLIFSDLYNNTDDMFFQRVNFGGDRSCLQLHMGDNDDGLDKFYMVGNGKVPFTVQTDNKVGIGTFTPDACLQMVPTPTLNFNLKLINGNADFNLNLLNWSNYDGIAQTFSNIPSGPLTTGNQELIGFDSKFVTTVSTDITGGIMAYKALVGSSYNVGVNGYISGQAGATDDFVVAGLFNNTNASANQWALYASGRTFQTTGVWTASDRAFKKEITLIEGALDNLLKLKLYSYYFDLNSKNSQELGLSSAPEKQFGVIAQELETVFPNLVTTDGLGNKLVKYEGLVPVALKAIQEQQKQIDELKLLVKALQESVNK